MSHLPEGTRPTSAFAYLRRLPGMDDGAIHQTLKELTSCIEQQGFALAYVFYEERIGDRLTVWCELIAACRKEDVSTVVVPSSEHFHHTPELAAFMREELAATIQGTVLLVSDAGTAANGEAATPDAQ